MAHCSALPINSLPRSVWGIDANYYYTLTQSRPRIHFLSLLACLWQLMERINLFMTQNGAEACLGSLFVVYFNGRVG